MPNRWLVRLLALVLLAAAGGAGLADRAYAAPPDGPLGIPPDRVQEPTADFYQGQLLLSWFNPPTLDWYETIVRAAAGTVAPATSTQGFLVYAGRQRSTSVIDLEPGTPYSFSFFARDLEGLEAAPATLMVSAAKVTMRANPTRVINGGLAQFTITVRDVLTAKPLPNRLVDLFGRRPGTDQIIQIDSARTTREGKAVISFRPPENFDYAAVYFGEGYNIGGYSADLPLPVAFLVKAKPSATSVVAGKSFTVTATIDPVTLGQVVLKEQIEGKWTRVVVAKLNSKGKATLRAKATRGTHTYRVRSGGTKRYVPGTSKTFTVTAR